MKENWGKKSNLEKSHAVFQSGQREHYQIWEGRQSREQADRQGGRKKGSGRLWRTVWQPKQRSRTKQSAREDRTVTLPDAD